MAEKTYLVKRDHDGDRLYAVGDTRVANPDDVKHLVPHVLEPIASAPAAKPKAKAKAEPKAANKAGPILLNKADA